MNDLQNSPETPLTKLAVLQKGPFLLALWTLSSFHARLAVKKAFCARLKATPQPGPAGVALVFFGEA